MRLSVIGCGYLGAVHAASMAELGHEVIGVDVDPGKVQALSAGEAPFFEPGLPEILKSAGSTGRLAFTTSIQEAKGARVHFIAVGTPQQRGSNSADLTYVDAAIDALIPHLSEGDLVVGKSTVPVGGADRDEDQGLGVRGAAGLEPGVPPRGLRRKGHDLTGPARLRSARAGGDAAAAKELLDEVYAAAIARATPLVVADYQTAELVKVAANAFLATKISFIDAMAEISEVAGADVTKLADAIGYDARIGRRFLNAGIGFGGGCLPKDIRAFSARAEELGRGDSVAFLKEIDAINLRRRQRMVDLVIEALGGQVFQKKVTVLGLAFKPDSDDVRDSPALDVAVQLNGRGAHVIATDPQAIPNSIRLQPQLGFATDTQDALYGSDCVVLVTEWSEYRELDPVALRGHVRTPLIIDGRNILDPQQWRAAGWTYIGMGRP